MTGNGQDIQPRGWHLGVDEAGRGCLAGPVTAGAVLAPPDFDWQVFPGLTDSKALSEAKRAKLRGQILEMRDKGGFYCVVGFSWPTEIDRVNILNATFRAMTRAICALLERITKLEPDLAETVLAREDFCLYIDGSQSILLPQWQAGQGRYGQERAVGQSARFALPRQRTVVGGDALVPAISAASILAKTQRDLLMRSLDKRWPAYGFARHKGYGTREHMEELRTHGLCPQHRKSFCKNLEQPAADSDQFTLF